jgi:hypothetical protein
MSVKQVLIITYYWPPSGGAGVQRWLKFVKYLPEFGWEPIIFTPENPEYPVIDHSLAEDIHPDLKVIKIPIWEPYSLYNLFTGRKKNEKLTTAFTSESKKSTIKEKISNWIRSNLFIPDAKKFWIKPSVKFLTDYLKSNPIDIIVTTGPPHSLHLIGYYLKKKVNIKWLADFRDPWTNIDFYSELLLTPWADKKHHKLEKAVIQNADYLVVIGNNMKKEFAEIGAKNVSVITNGFDLEHMNIKEPEIDKKFSLNHTGALAKNRNPKILWKVLSELIQKNSSFSSDFKLNLIGNVDHFVIESINKHGLNPFLNNISYIPHNEIIRLQHQAPVLLLLINNTKNAKGTLTGKFYEYLAAKRPILAIGPVDGDAACLLNETKAGVISGFEDEDQLKKNILNYYKLFKKKKLSIKPKNLEQFTRKELTQKLSEILNKLN